MFSISGTTIKLTRGDYLALPLILTKDGESYTPTESDVIKFGLKHKTMNSSKSEYTDATCLIEKTIPNDTLTLELQETDTKTLGFGEYVYDITVITDEKPYTPVNNAKFIIVAEVV